MHSHVCLEIILSRKVFHIHFTRVYFASCMNYEACPEVIETNVILSKRLNIIQNNLHSPQVLHIWDLGLNYLTAAFNGYDPVAF